MSRFCARCGRDRYGPDHKLVRVPGGTHRVCRLEVRAGTKPPRLANPDLIAADLANNEREH